MRRSPYRDPGYPLQDSPAAQHTFDDVARWRRAMRREPRPIIRR